MEREIPDSDIFPQVESGEALKSKTDLNELLRMKNYESVESQKDEAALEIGRYITRASAE